METHVFWKSRSLFISLMEDFVNGIINAEEFSDKFSGLFIKTSYEFKVFEKKIEKLTNFQPDLRSEKFDGFIAFIYRECEAFEDYYTEKQFKNSILKAIFQMQKYFKYIND